MELIQIDGSYLEGGGQIIRTALGLSALTGKAFEAKNIRKGRKTPGLKAQHLSAIRSLKELCNAKTSDVEIGSETLTFIPKKLVPKTLNIDIGTAGSITLLMQSLWAPLILGGGRYNLNIKGGTDVSWSMPIDYLREVFLPQMKRYADIQLNVIRRGFYPKGKGEVKIKAKGKITYEELISGKDKPEEDNKEASPVRPIRLGEQGHLIQIKGVSYASKELAGAEVAERQTRAAKHILKELKTPLQIRTEYCESESIGTGVVLWAIFSKDPEEMNLLNPIIVGSDALGERGKRAEKVGEEAAKKLIKEIKAGAAADRHLCDNMIPFIALFGGEIRTSEITDHTRTNIYTVSKFLGDILEIDEEKRIIRRKELKL